MRWLILMAAVFSAGLAAAQPAPGAGDTPAAAGVDAGRPGKHHAGKHKHRTATPQTAPGPAQPQGMVGGAGGPGGAACAGGRGDGPHSKHRSGNRQRVDPLTGAPDDGHGGGRCVGRS